MIIKLADILSQANADDRAVASFNTFGIEYATVCIAAAEELAAPVILSINMDMIEYIAIEPYVALLTRMAETSSASICIHLDHCSDKRMIFRAMDSGLGSVMYDGSQLPFETNIENTAEVVDKAGSYGISVEAELGSVPYDSGRDNIADELTKPGQVASFCRQSGCHALAVSVGNVHRLANRKVKINYPLLANIDRETMVPLVIHGASGIAMHDLHKLATTSSIAKCNIGTALRTCWYAQVATTIASGQTSDTLGVMSSILPAMQQQCMDYMRVLMSQEQKEQA